MIAQRHSILALMTLALSLFSTSLLADRVLVAVASNFTTTLQTLADTFHQQSGHSIRIASGSTGSHYAQIVNGAPFDLFLAADTEHPRRLVTLGIGNDSSRFTYASGRLALWAPKLPANTPLLVLLKKNRIKRLAIPNPELAPYGFAAMEVLTNLGVEKALNKRLIRGQNVGQTYQFIHSGAASIGFVAWSQILASSQSGVTGVSGAYIIIPETLYSPINQQALIIKNTPAVKAFVAFIGSRKGQKIITQHGYRVN